MKDVKKIVIAGAGTMGASMAETFAKYGYEVSVYDIYPKALEKAKKLIHINQETEVSEGIITEEESQKLLKKLSFSESTKPFREADFVVEAILENIQVKHKFWQEVSSIVPKDAILASNTSGLSITEIQKAVVCPERFGGMHWVNPPHIIPLIEVIQGEKTSDKTVENIYQMAKAVGKEPVIVKDAPGFALNRIQLAILRECLHIVSSGIASKEDVDKVVKYGLGPRYACLGPLEVCDLGGLDIFYNIASYLYADLADDKEPSPLLAECFEKGNFGVKTGAGFYEYSNGRDEEVIRYRDEMYTKIAKCLFEE